MSTSLVTDQLSNPLAVSSSADGDDSSEQPLDISGGCGMMIGEEEQQQVMEEMFDDQDQDFASLGVDFDFCPDLQLDGVDFPMDIWNCPQEGGGDDLAVSADSAVADVSSLVASSRLEESFSLDDDFSQMLNEWDTQLDSLQTSSSRSVEEPGPLVASQPAQLLPQEEDEEEAAMVEIKAESAIEQQTLEQPQPPPLQTTTHTTTVTVRKPPMTAVAAAAGGYRGLLSSSQARQVPISSPIRAPLATRGVCYTRTGGLGVSRSVHTTCIGTTTARAPLAAAVSNTGPYTVSSRLHKQSSIGGDEAPFLFTPVSPIRSPANQSSNAPDFFIASTRSTADVVKSSYSRLINQCRNSIITTNPDSSGNKFSQTKSSQVKIIAALSPKSDGTSSAKIISSNSIRESLPKELIDKIRAASQGRKTIAIIEPINRKEPAAPRATVSPEHIGGGSLRSKPVRFNAVNSSFGRWRNVGLMPPFSNSVTDHDYCSPNRASRFSRKYLNAQHKVMRQIEESMSRNRAAAAASAAAPTAMVTTRITSPVNEEGETRKDSGLESCEMSDASEDGSLYDKLPRYLTNASVQTVESRSVQEDHGYNRLPAYLIRPQKSLLKSNLSKSLAEKHNIVVSPVESLDQKTELSEFSEFKVGTDISLDEQAAASISTTSTSSTTSSSQTIKLETPANRVVEALYERIDSAAGEERSRSRLEKEKPLLKRRHSFDSSSDETDASYRRSYNKRRRSNHPREKGRVEARESRRRYRGRSRTCSSSPDRSNSRNGRSRDQDRMRRHGGGDRRDRFLGSGVGERAYLSGLKQEHRATVEERKIVYVGKIEEGTLKSDLRTRFEAFGPILDISVHFRERGDNYGFLTFQSQADATRAIEHGNDDRGQPKYDLCFGGRRTFCREEYYDMDDVEEDEAAGAGQEFDELLRRAKKEIRQK